MRVVIAKEAFNRKISLLTSKRNIEFMKKLVSYVWSIALYGSETWTPRKLEGKYFERFEMWCWRRMEKIKWSEQITNEDVGEKRTLLNNILHRKANWIVHILSKNSLLLDVIKGQMKEVKGVRRRRRRRRRRT